MFTASALLICSGYIGCNQIVVAVALVTLANGFLCLVHSGASVNHLDIAPQFAGILQGITNSAGAIPGMFSPMVVGFLTENKVCQLLEGRLIENGLFGGATYFP